MSLLTLTDENFDKEVVQAKEPTLVDFWAPWCVPCKQLTPIVQQLAEDYEGRLKVASVNLDDASGSAANFGIKTIPTILLFNGGEVVEVIVGVHPPEHYKRAIDKMISG